MSSAGPPTRSGSNGNGARRPTATSAQWASPTQRFYNGLGIKPTSANTGSAYLSSDLAGTPENFKSYVVQGATTGHDGSSWTGNYTPLGYATYQAYLLNE